MTAPTIEGLIEAPRETFPGFWCERWEVSTDELRRRAARRRSAIGRALPHAKISGKRGTMTRRWTVELGADRSTVEILDYTYCAPGGAPPVTEEQLAPRPRRVMLPVMDDEHDACPVARSA